MGRPPLPESDRRTEVLQLRLTKGERSSLEAGAAQVSEQLTEFIRSAALKRAKKLEASAAKAQQT